MRDEADLTAYGRVRVAIVSDTHGRLDPRVAEIAARHDCSLHAGDIGNAAVLDLLGGRLGLCLAVRGNNDRPDKWPAEDRDLLNRLPGIAWLRLPGGAVVVVHGDRAGRPADRHDRLRKAFTGARLIVYGHSHRRLIDRQHRPWVANPGAAGRSRTYGGPGLLSLSAGEKSWRLKSVSFHSA
ncbi:MAG: metallophosphoesterase family protein [Gammaproteobacteria bacterium]|nr:metallophosphoesterase family protein [Gammaproteobacteria bacterium]